MKPLVSARAGTGGPLRWSRLEKNVPVNWFLPPAEEPFATEAQQERAAYARGRIHFMVPDLFSL